MKQNQTYKKYFAAIILLYCPCCATTSNVCDAILKNKGYSSAIKHGEDALKHPDPYSKHFICKVGKKFSEELFTDAEAWLCVGSIIQMMAMKMTLYKTSIQRCNITNRFKDIACGNFSFFHLCISASMDVTLRGLAKGEASDQKPCAKCREYSNFTMCAKKMKLLQQCPAITRRVLSMNFAEKSCIACNAKNETTTRKQEDLEGKDNGTTTRKQKDLEGKGQRTSIDGTTTRKQKDIEGKSQQTRTDRGTTQKQEKIDTKGQQTAAGNKNRSVTIVVAAVSSAIAVLIVVIGVGYYLFKRQKMDKELEHIKGSRSTLGSNISLTKLKKGHNDKLPVPQKESPNSISELSSETTKDKRRKRGKKSRS